MSRLEEKRRQFEATCRGKALDDENREALDEVRRGVSSWPAVQKAAAPVTKSVTRKPAVAGKAVMQDTFKDVLAQIGADIGKRLKAIKVEHAAEISALTKRINHLEVECKQLRSQRMKYCGVYRPDTTYREGDVVTFKGQLWHADHDTQTEPEGVGAWTLCVRRGRDGKHARGTDYEMQNGRGSA